MSKEHVFAGMAMFVAAACCAADRMEQPEAWKPIPLRGQTFSNANLGDKGHMWQLWENYKDEPMYEEMFFVLPGPCPQNKHKLVRQKVEGGDPERKNIVRVPCKCQLKTPLKFSDLMRGWDYRGALVEKFAKKRPGAPMMFALWGSRPSWPLDEEYDTDRDDFAAWCAAHPGFVGFEAFDEYDNDIVSFRNGRHWNFYTDPEMVAWLDRNFPDHSSNEDFRPWTDTCYRKIRNFCWGTPKLTGLWSNYYSLGFNILRQGLAFAWYEVESGNSGQPWRWGAMYARGATRQFATPMGWYMATLLMNTQTRDGRPAKVENGDDTLGYTVWPNVRNRNFHKHSGQARSLLHRNEFYGMMIGSVAMLIEGGANNLSTFDPVETNKVVLSPYGEDLRDIFRWQKAHDRGIVYTPVALLTSTDEIADKVGIAIKYNHDVYAQMSFMNALVCPYADKTGYQYENCQRPKKGEQGLMYNSEFGEFVDAISPDAGQKTEDFYRALKCYKAAVLVGWFNQKFFDKAALVRYVKEGGVVYAENRHVEMGLIPAAVDGAKGQIVLTDSFYDPRLYAGKERWSYDKNRMLYSGEIENTKIKNLLRSLQDEYLPVKVEGDIQWGVNLAKNGWLVWLINNKGVTKWLFEPEEIDLSKTAEVKVTDKKTGKVYTASVKPGKFATIEIPFE